MDLDDDSNDERASRPVLDEESALPIPNKNKDVHEKYQVVSINRFSGASSSYQKENSWMRSSISSKDLIPMLEVSNP
jgi:hypothetical protein